MNSLTLIVLALGLAMDAFAVSMSNVLCFEKYDKKNMLMSSITFGIFQGIMPIIGFYLGTVFYHLISVVDHWIALILLGIIGGKMVIEGVKALNNPECCPEETQFTTRVLLMQGIATSIDALAVGISFAALSTNIYFAASVIMIITFIACIIAGLLGKKFGAVMGDKAQIIGGVILIIIGLKTFIEHVFLG